MPGPPPSILDYLSAKDRDRLQAASEAAKVDRNAPALPKTAEIAVDVPFTDPATASAALRGFMPFGDDLVKQERYRRYLTSQADPSAGAAMKFTPLVGQSAEQLNRELADFAKSAGIFRPMSTAMASRFTSASSASAASEIAQPAPGLHVPAPKPPEEAKTQEEESARSEEEKLTPAQQAVRMGLFGPLTRTVFEWYPVRLLCKRFNVPDPHPDKAAGTSGDAEADGPDAFAGFGPQGAQGGRGKPPSGRVNSQWEASKRQMEHLAASRAWERPGGGGPATPARASSSPAGTPGPGGAATEGSPAPARRDAAPPSLANVGLGDDEEQGRDTLTYVKPPMDIFKAIFASDDEDEEELETKSEAPKSKGQTKKSTSTQVVSKTPAATDAIADVADQSAFRPTFIPRTKRKGLTGDDLEEDEDGGEEGNGMAIPGTGPKRARLEKDGKEEKKKQKKDKDKEKKGKGMLTFSVDDEEGDGLPPAPKLKRDSQGGGKWAHQEALPSKGGENASKRRRDEAEEPKEQRTGLGGDGSSRPARPRASDLF